MSVEVVDKVLEKYNFSKSSLIGILQDIQRELRWLPEEVLRMVALRLDVPLTQLYALGSFYNAFSLKPRGRHLINICLGTACHVRGGVAIEQVLEKELKVLPGETTPDDRFTMEVVRCVGLCGLAPVIVIDENFHGKLAPTDTVKALENYK
ncbi:MAG: NAD(P)H-dependent oxidoreductase subunit E [Deltaproteobacteria bacterium]|nr:NAD(P)H-dependent oxidoreductase subunit E [Deltaproteobacteria bacterium]